VINGELVVLNDMGALLFDRLRWRALMSRHRELTHEAQTEPAAIFVFDLVVLDGENMRKRTLLAQGCVGNAAGGLSSNQVPQSPLGVQPDAGTFHGCDELCRTRTIERRCSAPALVSRIGRSPAKRIGLPPARPTILPCGVSKQTSPEIV